MTDQIPMVFARQPIMTADCRVFGYELLYRGHKSQTGSVGSAQSARVLCEALGNTGVEKVVGSAHMFVNFDQGLLETDLPLILPAGQGVIEIQEGVQPTPQVIATVEKLRRNGVGVAVDNFHFQQHAMPFLDYADYVKFDILSVGDDLESFASRLKAYNLPMIAEKVETREQVERCWGLGFHLFQGYFFAKPEPVLAHSIGASQLGIMALVVELQRSETEPAELAELIGKDLGLTHQILRLANSAAFRRQRSVGSITDAVVMLGRDVIRQWASLLLLTRIGHRKPMELLSLALTRARMCQSFGAGDVTLGADELFTVGLLSVLDALLDRPMTSVVEELPLEAQLQRALCGDESSPLGDSLRKAIAYESGNWSALGPLTPTEERESATAYTNATHFARMTMSA